jgi:Protein of unknown function (DUF3892)
MAIASQVIATRKARSTNGYTVITHVKLSPYGSIFSKDEACNEVLAGRWELYTVNPLNGVRVPVQVRHLNHVPYLITEADRTVINNLLSLPDC